MKPFLRTLKPEDENLLERYRQNNNSLETQAQGERLVLLGQLGEQARALGLFEASLRHLQEALKLARDASDPQAEVANRIRLGTTLQYLERFDDAEDAFKQAIEATQAPEFADLQDEALQKWGKFLAEKGQYQQARNCFEAALELRKRKAAPEELIDASVDAIELLEALGETQDGYAVTQFEAEFQIEDQIEGTGKPSLN